MHFMHLLKSLDDLIYELMTWLVFYPVTFWRTITRPSAMMVYSDVELADREDKQYPDTLTPPLFLLVTLLLSHGIELAVVGQSSLVADDKGLAGLISDDTSLLILRLVIFSIFPLIMALRLVHKKRWKLTRDTLRAPFYAQCYPAGPFALVMGLGAMATQLQWDWTKVAGLALMIAAMLWYGILQSRWFAQELGVSFLKGFWVASIGMVECVAVICVVAPLIS
jgi:hypothetical protein